MPATLPLRIHPVQPPLPHGNHCAQECGRTVYPREAPTSPAASHPHSLPRTKDPAPSTAFPPSPPVLLLDGQGGFSLSPQPPATQDQGPSTQDSSLFSPSRSLEPEILEAFSDPTFSLIALARLYDTSLDALTAWLDRPDIRLRLAALESACARRNRLVAAARIPKVVLACERIIDEYLDEEANHPIDPCHAPAKEQRRRSRETARRAASLIHRISRANTPQHRSHPPEDRWHPHPATDPCNDDAGPAARVMPPTRTPLTTNDPPEACHPTDGPAARVIPRTPTPLTSTDPSDAFHARPLHTLPLQPPPHPPPSHSPQGDSG